MTNNNGNSATATANGGIGVFGLAFIVLLVFKLAGMAGVSWGLASLSWWWVFAPLLVGFSIFVVFLVFALLIVLASK